MRGFLLFLAVAFPVVLASPTFWWLVQSEVGAAPGAIIEQDGAARATLLGPRSHWPDWAQLPENWTLTPRSSYASAPGHPAQGFGAASFAQPVRPAIAALTQHLTEAGWQVAAMRYRVADPTIPPRPLLVCTLTARRGEGEGERTLMFGFQLEPADAGASIFWIEGPKLASWGTEPAEMPPWTEARAGC